MRTVQQKLKSSKKKSLCLVILSWVDATIKDSHREYFFYKYRFVMFVRYACALTCLCSLVMSLRREKSLNSNLNTCSFSINWLCQ